MQVRPIAAALRPVRESPLVSDPLPPTVVPASVLREPSPPGRGFGTRQIHGGTAPDPVHGSRIPPIHLTAGYVFESHQQAAERFAGEGDGFSYTRLGNPTTADVERRLADLDGGADAILLSSGAAAVSVAVLALLGAGDHLLTTRRLYQGTVNLFAENLARCGIDVEFVDDPDDPADWAARLRPSTRALFVEPVPNPTNEIVDLAALAEIARSHGVPLVVDNTVATPYLLRPLEWGADVVVHSASKFLTGHGSALSGVIVSGDRFDWGARPELFPHLTGPAPSLGGRSFVEVHGRSAFSAYAREVVAGRLGTTVSPFHAFLLRQGLETLSLRMRQHAENGLAVARWLDARPEVLTVDHPGLVHHPHHALARRYLPSGQASVFTVTLAGGAAAAAAVIEALQLFSHMTHIGDVRSLVLHPATTTHALLAPAEQRRLGIHPGTLRLSVGLEDVDDLLADLAQALGRVTAGLPVTAGAGIPA